MSNPSYDIHVDEKYGSMTLIDLDAEAAARQPWFNQTLTKVNDTVIRLGVLEGEFSPAQTRPRRRVLPRPRRRTDHRARTRRDRPPPSSPGLQGSEAHHAQDECSNAHGAHHGRASRGRSNRRLNPRSCLPRSA
jgi:hypothetical protein